MKLPSLSVNDAVKLVAVRMRLWTGTPSTGSSFSSSSTPVTRKPSGEPTVTRTLALVEPPFMSLTTQRTTCSPDCDQALNAHGRLFVENVPSSKVQEYASAS